MRAEPIVEVSEVTKSYAGEGRAQVVLDHLSLRIDAGEMVAVVGPSGCGKTTLLNLIGGLDRPDRGTVSSCGVDLGAADRRTLTSYRARSVGFVFQFYNLLPTLTAAENIEAGLTVVAGIDRAEARERTSKMLGRVGLEGSANKFPAQLSGGEQQRVAVARALAKDPALVLADEPTGNLDEDNGAQVMALMQQLNVETGVTFVIVTHDPAVSASGKRIVRLERGAIVEGRSM